MRKKNIIFNRHVISMAISVYCLVLMLYPEGITCGYVDFRSSTEFFCKIAIGISFVNGMLGTFFKNIWEKLFKTLSIVAIICLAMFLYCTNCYCSKK